MPRFLVITSLVALALLSTGINEARAENPPDLNALIARVVARDAATQKELGAMQYHQDSKTEQFDESGRVTHQEQAQMIIRPGAAKEIQVLSVKGDRIPPTPTKR